MKKNAWLAGLILIMACSVPTVADDQIREAVRKAAFCVAPNGRDSNPGTLEKPFATLARARDAVREIKKSGERGDILVWIRGGTYTFTETVVFGLEDSGSKGRVITYAAYPGEEPVFSSGRKITGWKKLENPLPGLPEISQNKLWAAEIPETKGGRWRFYTLYDGHERLPRARSAGFKPVQDERSYVRGDFWEMTFAPPDRKSLLLFPKGVMRNWPNLEDVEIVIFPTSPYTMNILGLSSVDVDKGEARTAIPATYAMNTVDWYAEPVEEKDGPLRRESAWVENVPEALDEPGEWILDTHRGMVVLWPKGDSPGDRIVAPVLRELIRVEGRVRDAEPQDEPVQYLEFKGLTFTHGDRDLWTKNDAGIQHDWEMADKSTALLRFRAAAHCRVDECRFTASGGTGVRFDLTSQYNTVQNCLFDHLGQSGVFICGYGPGTKDVSFRNDVLNNRIHHLGEIYPHSHGIILWQSRENRVAHNFIHDMPRKAISCSGARTPHFDPRQKDLREVGRSVRWNEVGSTGMAGPDSYASTNAFRHVQGNVIEYNEVARVLEIGEDGGAINITGAAEGNVIRGNWIYDIRNPMADAAIRIDGTARGEFILDNIIYNCALPAMHVGDRNHVVENNIMIDCSLKRKNNERHPTQEGISIAKKIFYVWSSVHSEQIGFFMFSKGTTGRFLRNILYSSGPTTPFLLLLKGAELNQFHSDENLFYSAGDPAASRRFLTDLRKDGIEDQGMSVDPLFVDFQKRDFRLRPDSPMFKKGFKQIETDKIGLTPDFPERFKR